MAGKHTYIVKCRFMATAISIVVQADTEALALEKAQRHPFGKGAESYVVKERPPTT